MASSSPERETWYADVLVTSVEQNGYMNDYGTVSEYQWYFKDLEGGTAKPAGNGGGNCHYNWKPEGEVTVHHVNRRTVARAYTLLKQGPVTGLHESRRGDLIKAWHEMDAVDAEQAAILVQVGIFGEVVYS